MANEREVEEICLSYLTIKGWFCFKFKDQALFAGGRYRRPKPFQINGIPDAFAMRSGVSLWIEFKTKTGSQSKSQKDFQSKITAQGGIYWIVRSLEELKSKLGELPTP